MPSLLPNYILLGSAWLVKPVSRLVVEHIKNDGEQGYIVLPVARSTRAMDLEVCFLRDTHLV